MRPLMLAEKEKYFHQMSKFVDALNSFCEQVNVKQITYIIPIDGDYFYFDFPWSKDKDEDLTELNTLLDDNTLDLTKNTINVLNEFSNFNLSKEDDSGYIYYEYELKEECFLVNKIDSNFITPSNQETLLKYLPLIHYGSNLEGNYQGQVNLDNNSSGELKLLTFYKSLDVNSSREDDDNTIVCTFSTKQSINLKENKELKTKIYHLLTLIESYFDSPVLNKILSNSRKSYILGFKHNLDHLLLKSEANFIDRIINSTDEKNIPRLNKIKSKLKLIKMTHTLLFDYEYINAGFFDYDFLFKKASIRDVFTSFFDCKPIFQKNTIIEGGSIYTLKPIDNEGNYMMSDLVLILWNLWSNACIISNQYNTKTKITIEDSNTIINIRIKNDQEMPSDMINYITGVIKKNPREKPNRPYRGWTIIKDLVENNSNIRLNYFFEKSTEIVLIINK